MSLPHSNLRVSVVDPIGPAFERMKQILFRPFDPMRWLAIGFCAWLATLGEAGGGGGGGGGGWGGGNRRGGGQAWSFDDFWNGVTTFVSENWTWLVPVVVGGVLFLVALGVLVLWLSSRGRFMFLDNVVTNRAEVAAPWRDFVSHGNSLFRFRIILAVVGTVLALPLLGIGAVAIIGMVRRESVELLPMLVAILGVGACVLTGLFFAVIDVLTADFVVPVMWLRTAQWRVAWGEVFALIRDNVLLFVLYLLFRFVLALVIGVGVLLVILLTCCVAGCLLAIPVLGTVLLLPVLVFGRAYSLAYLAQFGPTFDVYQPRGATL